MAYNNYKLCIIFIIIVIQSAYAQTYPEFPGWNHRKLLVIDNKQNANSLANFEVDLDITYNSEMNNDFSDIRFTDSDAQTLLNFGWDINEDGSEKKTDSVSATAVVKVPSIPAYGEKVIYIYYGNPSATSVADLEQTLTWFDHFTSDRSSEYTYYSSNTTWDVENSIVKSFSYIYPTSLSIRIVSLKSGK